MNVLRGTSRALPSARRAFSGRGSTPSKLRVGYVPEHFLTPLHFAISNFGLDKHVEAIAFPRGTGTMIDAFDSNEIDAGIGLTEAWVAGLAKAGKLTGDDAMDVNRSYHIYSSYVTSPLRWALSTGAARNDIKSAEDCKKVGISRTGSGSHIMSYVLAEHEGWLTRKGQLPFEHVESGDFASLRKGVQDGTTDFFMWEHFTTKRYYDNGELKKIGELATPWNGWHIAAGGDETDGRLDEFLAPALAKGIAHFEENKQEAVDYICTNMDYSAEDASAWYDEVVFAKDLGRVDVAGIESSISSLSDAGVVEHADAVPWKTVLGGASRAWGEAARGTH